jgi:hypothetical protein
MPARSVRNARPPGDVLDAIKRVISFSVAFAALVIVAPVLFVAEAMYEGENWLQEEP